MCGLCGVLGISHWTELSAHRDSFTPTAARTVGAERQQRVRLVNRILAPVRIRVADWAASSYLVTSATGRSEVVDDVQAVWAAVEKLRGRPLDPLDDGYLALLAPSPA